MLTVMPLGIFPASAANYSGVCGPNLTWQLNTNTGVLTVAGNGKMYDYSGYTAPWYSQRGNIKTVIINSGVTSLLCELVDSILNKGYSLFGCIL